MFLGMGVRRPPGNTPRQVQRKSVRFTAVLLLRQQAWFERVFGKQCLVLDGQLAFVCKR